MAGKKQWYAMRSRLQKEGKWHGGNAPGHSVPAQEDGEPPSKAPRLEETPEGARAVPEDPEEGTSYAARGM